MANGMTEFVEMKIDQLFKGTDNAAVREAFEKADFPQTTEYERIFLAILKISEGDLERFARGIELARMDWRDVLVCAGMGNFDWRERLIAEGFI